jgi:hypothetical protein
MSSTEGETDELLPSTECRRLSHIATSSMPPPALPARLHVANDVHPVTPQKRLREVGSFGTSKRMKSSLMCSPMNAAEDPSA